MLETQEVFDLGVIDDDGAHDNDAPSAPGLFVNERHRMPEGNYFTRAAIMPVLSDTQIIVCRARLDRPWPHYADYRVLYNAPDGIALDIWYRHKPFRKLCGGSFFFYAAPDRELGRWERLMRNQLARHAPHLLPYG